MNRIKIYVVGYLLVCGSVVGAEREPIYYLSTKFHPKLLKLTGPNKMILEARQMSEAVYFFEVSEAMERGLDVGKEGGLSFKKARSCAIGGYGLAPDKKELTRAILLYRKTIEELTKAGSERKRVAVPFHFLGGVRLFPVSDVFWPKGFDEEKVRQGYQVKPSDLAALAYLELALLEKKLGRKEEYSRLLKEAVVKLKLLEIHYCTDTIFREHLHESLNFARPETCVLFLAGEDARLKGRAAEARNYYATLIERAPGSPFAWEALAKLVVMGDMEGEQMDWLKSILLHTYPLVWGCPREYLKLDKDGFAAELPALLRKAGEEGRKDGQRSGKSS